MKKLFSVVLIMASVVFVFSSCSKEDENSLNGKTLVGTTWESAELGTLTSLTFENNSIAKITKSGNINDITIYKYSYSFPNITFKPTEKWCVTLEGKIKDNTMIIENPTITSGSKVIYILYKK